MTEQRVPYGVVVQKATALLESRDVERSAAAATAELLAEAEGRGYPTQGITRVFDIVAMLERGLVHPRRTADVHVTAKAVEVLDATRALGPPVALDAVERAVTLAHANGVGVVGVLGASHIGCLANYAERAAAKGCFAVVTTTSSPAVVLPGGCAAVLGTNPVAFAFEYEGGMFSADFSTAEVSRGVVLDRLHRKEQFSRPVGVGPDGGATSDPAAILRGGILPIGGGWKGAFVNILVAMLAGPLIGGDGNHHVGGTRWFDRASNKGDVFLCFDTRVGGTAERFRSVTAEFVSYLLESCSHFRIPGERGRAALREARSRGLHLSTGVSRLVGV